MARRVPAAVVFSDPVHLLAFGLGAGLAPVAPGTFGTLAGVPLALAAQWLGLWPALVLTVALFVAGIWLCGESARRLEEHDHPGIVWDEIVGFLLPALAAPPGWLGLLAAFALFRLFDVLKPWPIREIDHSLSGGLGIMLDDALAGLYASVVLLATRPVWPI